MAMIGATEAARLLGCTRQNLDKLRKSGKLLAKRGNRNNWLYSEDEIERYLAENGAVSKPPSPPAKMEQEQLVGEQHTQPLLANLEQLATQLLANQEQQKAEGNKQLADVVNAATEPLLKQIDRLTADKQRLEAELQNLRSRGFWDRLFGRER